MFVAPKIKDCVHVIENRDGGEKETFKGFEDATTVLSREKVLIFNME